MGRFIVLFIIFAGFLLSAADAQSVSEEQLSRYWMGLSLGAGVMGQDQGDGDKPSLIAGAVYGSLRNDNIIISLRRTMLSGLLFGDHMNDTAILFGFILVEENSLVSLSTGIGRVKGSRASRCLSCEREPVSATIGMAFGLQVHFWPNNPVGAGFYFFGNLNKEASLGGVALGFRFGNLR